MSEESRKELLEIIETIANLARKRHEIRRERAKIWDRTSVIRAELLIDIARAKNANGKPVYTNDQLREAALTLRLDKNEKYRVLKEKLRELDDEEQTLSIEHSRLRDQKTILMTEMSLVSSPSSNK